MRQKQQLCGMLTRRANGFYTKCSVKVAVNFIATVHRHDGCRRQLKAINVAQNRPLWRLMSVWRCAPIVVHAMQEEEEEEGCYHAVSFIHSPLSIVAVDTCQPYPSSAPWRQCP